MRGFPALLQGMRWMRLTFSAGAVSNFQSPIQPATVYLHRGENVDIGVHMPVGGLAAIGASLLETTPPPGFPRHCFFTVPTLSEGNDVLVSLLNCTSASIRRNNLVIISSLGRVSWLNLELRWFVLFRPLPSSTEFVNTQLPIALHYSFSRLHRWNVWTMRSPQTGGAWRICR